MKYTLNLLGIISSVVILVGCSQRISNGKNQNYQTQSERILGNFSGNVSGAYGSSGTSRGMLGVTNTYTDPNSIYSYYSSAGGVPTATSANYYTGTIGSYDLNQSMQAEAQACVTSFAQISAVATSYQTAVANFKPAIAQLTRCLNRIIVNRNPAMTFGYRNLSDQGQQMWSYLLNWRQPGTMSGFDINSFNGLLQLIPANGY